jgi:hypothetical protein
MATPPSARNAMEYGHAVRHELPLLCIIGLKGGWTADPQRNKPGRDRGYKMAAALGCYAESCRLSRAASRVEEGRQLSGSARRRYGFPAVKPDPHTPTLPRPRSRIGRGRRRRYGAVFPILMLRSEEGDAWIGPDDGKLGAVDCYEYVELARPGPRRSPYNPERPPRVAEGAPAGAPLF